MSFDKAQDERDFSSVRMVRQAHHEQAHNERTMITRFFATKY